MSTPNDGGPAFPRVDSIGTIAVGMSLRDYFAAKAIAASDISYWSASELAASAYELADAMLAERKKGQP